MVYFTSRLRTAALQAGDDPRPVSLGTLVFLCSDKAAFFVPPPPPAGGGAGGPPPPPAPPFPPPARPRGNSGGHPQTPGPSCPRPFPIAHSGQALRRCSLR